MRHTACSIAAVAFSVSTLSCFVPETFHATLNVDKARRYHFTYDGTIVFGLALDEIGKSGAMSPSSDEKMRELVLELRETPGFVSAEYVGRGRFRVQFRESGVITSGRQVFLDLVKFNVDRAGRIRVQGANVSLKDQRQLKDSGLKLDGTIRLTTALSVVEHNAPTTPWFGGLFGAYKWRVDSAQQPMPTILLQ